MADHGKAKKAVLEALGDAANSIDEPIIEYIISNPFPKSPTDFLLIVLDSPQISSQIFTHRNPEFFKKP
jgi:hypothetical protein